MSAGRTSAARLPQKKKHVYVTTSHKHAFCSLGYDAADVPSQASRKPGRHSINSLHVPGLVVTV
ncbi:hypothetical protein [Paenisporosarcina sp. TG-14]|uniref:hypothetical protein n=1 Tax=Paenisporosarcina sp. TG-14 TaxID=1231057 RepID=UPI0002EC13D2|nr:hypothetical protein [Paenisporosarcina sp. TG-14]